MGLPRDLARLKGGRRKPGPIAGTGPRTLPGGQEDLHRELLADAKERSEHLMLVDLGRDDLGRFAGTRRSGRRTMAVEEYSTLCLVSSVKGTGSGEGRLFAAQAVFPGGTLSGAPKARPWRSLKSWNRAGGVFYGGAVGYIGFDGQMDTYIGIRSAVAARGRIHLQAGAGIVAASDPAGKARKPSTSCRRCSAPLPSWKRVRKGGCRRR